MNTAPGHQSDVKILFIYWNDHLSLTLFTLLSIKSTSGFFFKPSSLLLLNHCRRISSLSHLSHDWLFSQAVISLTNVSLNVLNCEGRSLLFMICMTRSARHSCDWAAKMAFSANSYTYSKRKWRFNAYLVLDRAETLNGSVKTLRELSSSNGCLAAVFVLRSVLSA